MSLAADPIESADRSTDERPLSDRLVDTTLELLASEGLEALTLRAIARRAGVSHGAPLRHFRSLSDLRAEVAAHGFRLLRKALETAAASLSPGAGALARAHAAGRAYVETAVEHAALFGLMFRPDTLDTTNERFQKDSAAAFETLVMLVRGAQDSGWNTEHDTRLLAGVIWSQVHGLASLWAQGATLGVVPDATLEDMLDLSLEISFVPKSREL